MDPITLALGAQLLPQLLSGAAGGATPTGGAPPTAAGGPLSLLSGGLSNLGTTIRNLISGPGRGETRRASARNAVSGSPPLLRVQAFMDQAAPQRTHDQILAALRAYLPRDPEARQALAGVLARVGQLGGSGKAQGTEANTLGDVLKWVLLHETVTKNTVPSDQALAAAVVGVEGPQTTPISIQPVGPPQVLVPPATLQAPAPASLVEANRSSAVPAALLAAREFVSATPASFTPTEAPMGNFLDSLNAGAGALSSLFAPAAGGAAAPFVLPGGAMVAGALGLSGLSSLLPSVGLPFVDIAPSGGAALFEPFRRTPSGARAQLHIQVNPATDKPEFFAPVGRPLIFSRDFATVKRMKRLGGRMVTATGGHRGRMVRRRRGGR